MKHILQSHFSMVHVFASHFNLATQWKLRFIEIISWFYPSHCTVPRLSIAPMYCTWYLRAELFLDAICVFSEVMLFSLSLLGVTIKVDLWTLLTAHICDRCVREIISLARSSSEYNLAQAREKCKVKKDSVVPPIEVVDVFLRLPSSPLLRGERADATLCVHAIQWGA